MPTNPSFSLSFFLLSLSIPPPVSLCLTPKKKKTHLLAFNFVLIRCHWFLLWYYCKKHISGQKVWQEQEMKQLKCLINCHSLASTEVKWVQTIFFSPLLLMPTACMCYLDFYLLIIPFRKWALFPFPSCLHERDLISSFKSIKYGSLPEWANAVWETVCLSLNGVFCLSVCVCFFLWIPNRPTAPAAWAHQSTVSGWKTSMRPRWVFFCFL